MVVLHTGDRKSHNLYMVALGKYLKDLVVVILYILALKYQNVSVLFVWIIFLIITYVQQKIMHTTLAQLIINHVFFVDAKSFKDRIGSR